MEPPEDLVAKIQKRLTDFFWSGNHWTKASTLFLPRQEGGQGLVDIKSRIKTFRLQTVKRFLYGVDVSWSGVACALLRRAGGMGLDKHLFLLDIQNVDLTGLTSFYHSVFKAWRTFNISRDITDEGGLWSREEPLMHNSMVDSAILKSPSMRNLLKAAGVVKIGHLITSDGWMSPEMLASKIGIRSIRRTQKLINEILESLSTDFKRSVETTNEDMDLTFPELRIIRMWVYLKKRRGLC